ncbi:MAG TPA: beta-ketoacyl-ACP synthase 3 [Steroidobacteraceae bacterium]|nr:beta-ketoacyl-ACP synthase 3 [Steroidobacteraceae bacterium]
MANVDLQILGTGEFVPSRRVSSIEFDQRWSMPAGWTFEQTGVESRAFAGDNEDVVFMAVQAAQEALTDAGLLATDIDAIVAVGSVPAQAIPCTAAFIHRALGLSATGVAAFDINATCLGFIVALDVISASIAIGRFRHVLIVASEIASAGLDWNNTATAGLFGDGAGAVVIGAARRKNSDLLATHLQTFSEGVEYCQVQSGGTKINPHTELEKFIRGTYFEMKGRHTYRLASKVLPEFLDTLMTRAGVLISEIDIWIPHQASGLAIQHLQRQLGLPPNKFAKTLATHGNQISASLPVALHRSCRHGLIKRGDLVVLIGTGAGLSVGGAVLRY